MPVPTHLYLIPFSLHMTQQIPFSLHDLYLSLSLFTLHFNTYLHLPPLLTYCAFIPTDDQLPIRRNVKDDAVKEMVKVLDRCQVMDVTLSQQSTYMLFAQGVCKIKQKINPIMVMSLTVSNLIHLHQYLTTVQNQAGHHYAFSSSPYALCLVTMLSVLLIGFYIRSHISEYS